MSLATHLLFEPKEGEGRIFTERATVMLTQLLLAARLEGYAPFPYVRHMIRLGLPAAAERLSELSPVLATQFLDVQFDSANFDDRFLTSAWGTLTAKLRRLLTQTVIRSLTTSDFTAHDIMTSTKPYTIYFRWPERHLLALSPLVRLLWGCLIDELIETYDQAAGRNCQPVLLLIDEAGRTAIPSLADHATTVVGRGISLWIAVQSLYQLNAVYGRDRAHILRDNLESQLYFRPADQETADYLERRLGRRSDYAHSHTLHEGEETSQGLSEQGVPLLTAQQIQQLGNEDILLFHRHLPPICAKRMDWRNFPILRQRRAIPAPKLSTLPAVPVSLPPSPWQRGDRWPFASIDPDEIN